MAAKFLFVVCASALLVNTINAQLCGCNQYSPVVGIDIIPNSGCGFAGAPVVASGYNTAPGYNIVYPSAAVSSGGAFGTTSSSPISPSGISLYSDNSIEGYLEVIGSLPVIAGVAFDGTVPSSGSAAGSYSCGNGNVGISSDSLAAAGIGSGNAYGIGAGNAYGIGAGNAYGIGAGNAYGIGAANLGALNLGSSIVGAEIAGFNAGLTGAINGCGGCGYSIY